MESNPNIRALYRVIITMMDILDTEYIVLTKEMCEKAKQRMGSDAVTLEFKDGNITIKFERKLQ